MTLRCLLLLCVLLFMSIVANAQLVTMDRFKMESSSLFTIVKELRTANPKITTDELVIAANAVLENKGFNFEFHPDAATCEKIKKISDARKDPKAPLNLGTALQSVGAEKASLALPEPRFRDAACGNCVIDLPVLELTDDHFINLLKGQNIKFAMPGNLRPESAMLIDASGSIKKKWFIPYRTTPIGISYDENVLYIDLNDPELSELSLAIFGEGVFQFASRKEAIGSGPGSAVTSDGPTKTVKFEHWKNSYTIRYPSVCN